MDFLRWVVLQWEEKLFENGLITPVIALNLIVIGISFFIHIILGSIVATISIIFWGFIGYVFGSKVLKILRDRYEREKNKP